MMDRHENIRKTISNIITRNSIYMKNILYINIFPGSINPNKFVNEQVFCIANSYENSRSVSSRYDLIRVVHNFLINIIIDFIST